MLLRQGAINAPLKLLVRSSSLSTYTKTLSSSAPAPAPAPLTHARPRTLSLFGHHAANIHLPADLRAHPLTRAHYWHENVTEPLTPILRNDV
jgi:hypothetical protein